MTISASYPFNLQNGTTADATQVMANFLQIQNDVNANAAHSGANSDITQLSGLTTPLSIPQGGTGATTSSTALAALGGIDAATLAAAVAGISSCVTGEIKMWATTAVPAGYLECNGAAVSRTTYAALFAIWGTYYGAGDGSTTFNVLDMRGWFLRGWDHGAGVDPGRGIGTQQGDTFQNHSHSISDPGHAHSLTAALVTGNTGGGSNFNAGANSAISTNSATTGISVGNANSGSPGTETRPKNIALMFIVKT